MKRFLAAAILLAGCATAPPPPPEPIKIVIVGTTDVHGWFNGREEIGRDGKPSFRYGGLPLFASYVNALRAENGGRVIVVDSGDMFQGTLESNLFEGEPLMKGYNEIGYAAAAVGNHEFDFGPAGPDSVARKAGDDPLGALKKNASIAKFPFLAANMREKATGQTPLWARRSTIVTVDGVKVGIIGLATPDTPNVTTASNVATLSFDDPVAATVAEAADLRAKGVAAVIVIAHIGGRCTDLDDVTDVGSCESQQHAMRYVSALPAGTIDGYFAGHTHAQMRHVINGVPTLQAMPFSQEFSTLDLVIDRQQNRVKDAELRPLTMICSVVYSLTERCDARSAPAGATLVPRVFLGREMKADPKVAQTLAPYLERVAAKRNEPLGITTSAPFRRAYLAESELGNLTADALRLATGADIAFMNSGGIRATLRAGNLVYSDLFEVSPFDNYPAVVILTPDQIHELLRLTTTGERGVLQTSGMKYTIDAAKDQDKPAEQRDRVIAMTLANGQPLDPNKLYKVAMPDFVAGGGDATAPLMKTVPADRIGVDQSRPLREVLIEGLKQMPQPLVPKREGRITVLNPKAADRD